MKRKYDDADKLQEVIDDYFEWAESKEKPYTFAGLAYHLGFCQRQSLNQYADKDDDLSIPVKRAMLKIEADYEANLRSNSCTGSIFALKNRGWSDKKELELSGGIGIDSEFKIVDADTKEA